MLSLRRGWYIKENAMKNTTGSERHDMQIQQIRMTERVKPCKRKKHKKGYIKHKGQIHTTS